MTTAPNPVPTTCTIPDFIKDWPFPRTTNPAYRDVAPLSDAWVDGLIKDFDAFTPKYREFFFKCKFGLLSALAYPHHSPAHLRTCCDYLTASFIFDDITDDHSHADASKEADIAMDALRNPDKPRPKGESVSGEVHRSFWSLASKTASATAARRFILHYDESVQGIAREAHARENDHVHSISDYYDHRRVASGIKAAFDLLLLPVELPDSVLDHPKIVELETLSIDMVFLVNDVFSYDWEQSRAHEAHNVITVVKKEHGFTLQEAVDFVGKEFRKLSSQFVALSKAVPTFDDLDGEASQALDRYIWGMGNLVTAIIYWSYESERYFGTRGPEVMKHHLLEISPKRDNPLITSKAA